MTKEELAAAIGLGLAASGHDTTEAHHAFTDAIAHGTGWMETKIDSDGAPYLARIDPLEARDDRITPDQIEEIARSPWAFPSAHISRALRQQAVEIATLGDAGRALVEAIEVLASAITSQNPRLRRKAGEVIHHINGNRQDNRLENIEVRRVNAKPEDRK